MRRPPQPARYRLLSHPDIRRDVAALGEFGVEVVRAARAALDDLAHGRTTGKALGVRHVSGDLTGCCSAKFDIAGARSRRFRLVYRDIDSTTRGVVAIGVRDEHAIYRLVLARIGACDVLDDNDELMSALGSMPSPRSASP